METIYFANDKLYILDQRILPTKEEYVITDDYKEVCHAIKTLAVRGAPAIGIASAYAVYLAAKDLEEGLDFLKELEERADEIKATRPTAVNLSWAADRQLDLAREKGNKDQAVEAMLALALEILEEDIAMNKAMGDYGQELFEGKVNILTHCNAGSLATGGYGTALGVIRSVHREGKLGMVYADETRPLLQGSRLTVYELMRDQIPVTLITDNMAAWHIKNGHVDAIVTGADRIAANGDAANKIGTYNLAVLAAYHKIPMYIAAPYSTFDLSIESGQEIVIEERDHDEVRTFMGAYSAPKDALVSNPAFDVTPADLITAIITEKGVISPVNKENVRKILNG